MGLREKHLYEFGRFRLDAGKQRLLIAGEPVALPPKAVELLLILVEKHGEVVEKDFLMSTLWPETIVEEANLTQNIYLLRKALGKTSDGGSFIETHSKRGYRFVPPVHTRIADDVVADKSGQNDHVIEFPRLGPVVTTEGATGRGLAALAVGDLALRNAVGGKPAGELEVLRGRRASSYQRASWFAAALIVVALAFAAYRWKLTPGSMNGVTSLVVMPLTALGASDQSHLEQGMSEAVITRLAALRQLRVPPAAAIKANEDPFDAAKRLGVDAVLTGSVQRAGDRLRVTAQLSRVSDHRQIWAAQYDEVFTGVFGIQDAIAERVAASLVTELSPNDRAMLTRHESLNPEAYDLYLRAREQWARRTPPAIRTAIRMYQQAIAIDPDFALAYAGLADSYNLAASGMSPLVRAPLAKAAAERAVALDPNSVEAHTAMAFLEYKFEWKWEDADREFRQAIALNPRYALAHHWYGEFLKLLMRHEESIREFHLAVEADPFSIPVRYDFISSLLNARRIVEARSMLDATIAIDPTPERVLRAESQVLAAEGRLDESVELGFRAQLVAGISEAPTGKSESEVNILRAAYRAGGLGALNRKRLDVLLAKVQPGTALTFHLASDLSEAYAALGDRDRTIFWLTQATDLKEDEPLLMLTHRFDFLRQVPEFIALERHVGLVR